MADPISGTVETTRNPDGSVKTVKETFEVSEAAVQAIRNETPVGANGQPVMRIPKTPKLVQLVNSGVYQKRIASEERCLRLVTVPLQGGKEGEFHCSRACVTAGTDGEKYCPEHDKEAFKPIQDHPPRPGRAFNSDSVQLTPAEQTVTFANKDGQKVTVQLERGVDVGARRQAAMVDSSGPTINHASDKPRILRKPAIRTNNVRTRNPGVLRIEFTPEELAGENVIELFVDRATAALDAMPAGSIAQMKKVVAVQEWLDQIKRAEIRLPEEGK